MLPRAEVETSSVEKCEQQIPATKKYAEVTGEIITTADEDGIHLVTFLALQISSNQSAFRRMADH